MAKTNKLSKIFVVLLFVVVAVALTFAFVNVPTGAARAEEISITIYNKGNGEIYSTESQRTSEWRYRSGNGSVTYNGETITAEDAKNTPEKTITANITEEGLQVKAEAQQDSLFFCWATDAEAKNIVSMRSEDTFTYEEVQSFQEKELYAFFVPILGEDVRAAAQFQITYDDTLGDVYFFSGKENVENETLKKHGLPIPSGQLIDIPFVQREVWSTRQEPATLSTTSREVSNLTFAAIPKTEIDSTIDLSRKTSAVFKEWSATYSAYQNRELLSQENRSLPEICDTSQNSSSIDPDGSKQYFPNQQTPVDGTWFCSSISVGRSLESGISFSPEKVYGNTNTNWLINPFNNMEEYSGTISVLPQTISAEFQEVAIVPEIEVTPYVNDEMKDPITFDRESTEHITFYYGQKNSINAIFVNSDQLVKQPEYQVKQTLLDGTTGKYTSKTIPITQVMGTVSGFNISEIDNSCTITIIPNYGEEYYIDTFTIAIDLVTEKGFEDIVSKESEAVTVVSGDDWYFNPQLTSNGIYTFTSGISYQVNLSKKSDSQLHFQVKGSGVFTFEFYLDGAGMEPYMPPAYAVYGTVSPINKNGITSGSFGDNTTALAKGNTVVGSLTDIHYYPCTILAVDKVTRIDEVTDWCRASIAVTAENDDTVTDIYVAHIATPYNSEYGSIFGPHTAMSVRNVAYYQGHSDVSWDIYDNAEGDKSEWGIISAQSGGKEASQTDLTSGTLIDFSIKYEEVRYKFYGWSDGAELLSTEKEFSYTVKGKTDGSSKTKICAVLAPTNQPYSYRTGGEFYDENSLEDALTMAAERSANVYVLRSVEITKSVTIAPNVNLVIPFDGTNRLHGSADEKDDVQEKISWLVDGDTYKYFTVTIAEEAILTVNGGLYLGGVVNYPSQTYQGHTSGAYSEIVNNGKIVIDDGGIMDVYGHVTGNGSIEVNKNAKLYEPFLILDYAGGTNTLGIFSAGQTPFKRYAMINIECPMTINYGGMLYGHATLYALSAFFSLDQPFVSYDMGSDMGGDGFGHDTIIMLTEGASVTITYNSKKVVHSEVATNCTEGIGQTKLVFDGGAIFSYMLFSAMGLEIPTNSVYFSIPYNFEVEMNGKDAVYETKTDFMIMPGATVKVGTGATLTLNANAWIFDGMVQGVLDGKSYPKANELENAGYSKNGNLIVDGTLRIGQKTTVEGFDFGSLLGGSGSSSFVPQEIPATFLGVVQTNGTGKIEIPEKTILQATIIDGIENRTYFSYTTTARVWDKAHSCFGNLEAGKTYTATGNAEFKLDSIKYTNTKGGEDTLTLTLNQQMHGSWMEVHEGHQLDWTPKAEDGYDKLGKGNTHVTIHRQCSVLGCSHKEDRELLFKVDSLGNVVYTGSEITEDEFKQLFKLMFGVEGLEEHAEFAFDPKTNVGEYDLTITLDSNFAYWYNGNAEAYAESYQLKYHIVKKGVTVEILDQHVTYNGAEQSAGSVANKDWQLKEGSSIAPKEDLSVLGVKLEARGTDANSYDITLSANTSNYNVKFEYKGSVAESVAKNAFVIDKANIKIKANDLESAQDDALLDVSAAGYTFLEDTHFFSAEDKQLFDSNLAYACEGLSNATVAEYDIVITIQDGFTMQNYNLETPANGTYYVRDSIFKDVKVTLDGNESLTVTFDGRYHKLAVTGLAPEIQDAATISYKYQGADMPTEGFRNANEYPVEISIKVAGHSNEYTATHTLKIEAAPITIKILPQSKVYDGKNAVLAQDKWEKTDGNWVDGTTPEEIIALKFAGSASVKNYGKYNITGECTDSNYKVNFTDGTEAYSIEKAPLTVTAHDQRSTYGENPVTVGSNGTYTIDGWLEEAALDVNVSHTVTNTTPWKEGGYEITVSVPAQTNPALGNYDLHEVNGTYTVDKRNVTVNIKDQNDVFEFGKTYSFDLTAWELDASTPLANGEQSSVLHIALARPTFDGAGKYAITATYSNDNYNVTFEGNWATEDENEGKAGTYTIDKKTLTDDSVNVIFMLIIGDEDESHEDKLSVIFNGDPIALDALVYVTENSAPKSLAFTISPAQLTEVKEYSVTVTIDDKNYAGSRTFTVEVLTAEGYSQTLSDALKQLKEIVGDLTADTLTSSEEHFDIIKRVKAILDGLSEEDKTAGAEQLAKYEELVETWETAADISDDVIDTAKDIADLPIKWLFAMAEMSILLAAMYVIGKGGLM